MTPADLAKLRATQGCGKPIMNIAGFQIGEHHEAVWEVDKCDKCLTLLVDAARAGAVEECAKRISDLGDAEGNREFETPEETLRSVERQNTLYNASDALLLPPPSATATECVTCHGEKLVRDFGGMNGEMTCPTCKGTGAKPPPAVKREGEKWEAK